MSIKLMGIILVGILHLSCYSGYKLDDISPKDIAAASFSDDDYDEIEEIAFEPSIVISTRCSSSDLKSCRRLFINDMEITLEDIEEDGNDSGIIKAKYQDDIQFECELPNELLRENTYDWSMNGFLLGLNDTAYSLVLDKRVQTNNTFLNVSCHFFLNGQETLASLSFPPINLDAYYFEYYVNQNDYLKMKYQKQIAIFNISIIVVLILAMLIVMSAWVYQIRVKNRLKYSEYVIAE